MEEEINLVDYIKVIYRQRWFILVVIILFLVVALVFSFKKGGKVYEGKGVFEIGKMDIYQKENFQTFIPENPTRIKIKIESRAYDPLIREKDLQKEKIKGVELELPSDLKDIDRLSVLTIKVQSTDKKEGEKYLKALLGAIVSYHNQEFARKENYFKNLIKEESAKILSLEKSQNISVLQYLYVEHLSNINDAKLSLSSIERTKILEVSGFSEVSGTKIILNTAIGLVLGVFVGVFLAFLRDFWQRNKKEILKG